LVFLLTDFSLPQIPALKFVAGMFVAIVAVGIEGFVLAIFEELELPLPGSSVEQE